MGRRPLSAKNTRKALSNMRTGLQSKSSNFVLEESKVGPRNSKIIRHPQSVTKSINPTSSKRKFSKCTDIVRRSKRLQSLAVEPVIEDPTANQSGNKESPLAQERENPAGSPLKKRSYRGKLDYLIELIEEQGNTIKELSAKVSEKSGSDQSSFAPDVRYKSLCIESQKKIDALTEEKRELSQKLEIALIKIEACERGTEFAMEFLDKLKDLVLVANFSRPMQQAASGEEPTTSLAKKSKRRP